MSERVSTGRVTGKVAIITGAAGAIGSATARQMVDQGARVVLADRNAEGLSRLCAELGQDALGHECDIAQESSAQELTELARSRFGRLDVIHSNAVFTYESDKTTTATPDEVWRAMFEVIVMATVWLCRHGIPLMRETGGGSIIATSSGAARTPTGSKVAYGTVKAALESLTRYTASMYGAEGIRCNAVSPGFVLTDSTRSIFDAAALERFKAGSAAGRLCLPEDIADVVVFLASDAARYVSGQLIPVNGGGAKPFAW